MRIAFLWDWDIVPEQAITWKDGLARAIQILSERHSVRVFAVGADYVLPHEFFPIHVKEHGDGVMAGIIEYAPDVILHWGDMTRPHAKILSSLNIPMAICFAGGATDAENWYRFGHVFVENEEYRKKFDEQGVSVSIAFGTNTKLYTPITAQKTLDAYFPATFADWKRHNLFTESTRGLRTMCAGYMYPVSERYCWEDTMNAGVLVTSHISAEANRMLMAQTRCVLVTSKNVGGSQRTVLEALAMNTPVIVMSDNIKCAEYLRSVGCEDWIVEPDAKQIRQKIEEIQPCDTRTRLIGLWDEYAYANELERELLAIL